MQSCMDNVKSELVSWFGSMMAHSALTPEMFAFGKIIGRKLTTIRIQKKTWAMVTTLQHLLPYNISSVVDSLMAKKKKYSTLGMDRSGFMSMMRTIIQEEFDSKMQPIEKSYY